MTHNTVALKSSNELVSKLVKQMGKYMFIKWCKNLGIDAEDCIAMLTGKTPTVLKKPHLFVPYMTAQ